MATCSTGILQLASLQAFLWHESGLALSHWAFKESSIFAAQVTRDKIKLVHFITPVSGSASLVDTSERRLSCHSVTH